MQDAELVIVKNLMPHLRKSYGLTQSMSREKAIRGVGTGIWEIIEDPPGNKVTAIKKDSEIPVIPGLKAVVPDGMITIIVIALNNLGYTQKCINSIKSHTKEQYQLIVVDNGSNDGTSQWLANNLRNDDIIIRNQHNKGFSKANNQALKLAEGDYILYLNNDTEIKDKSWVQKFLIGLQEADIIGPTIRRLIQDNNAGAFIFLGDGTDKDTHHYIEGWCIFGKRTVFQALGGMDEQFTPAYSEDADLSFKAIQAGYKLKKVDVPIVHFGSKTSAQMGQKVLEISERNKRKLYRKWVSKSYRTILVRRHGAIGDVLMITPILRALKEANREAKIFVETSCPQLLEGNPNVDHIAEHINPAKFDKVIDLEYEKTPGRIRIDSMAEQAEVKLKNRKMEVFFPNSGKLNIKPPFVAFHTGRSWVNREWPIERFNRVAEWLIKNYYTVVQLGAKSTLSMNVKGVIDYRGRSWQDVTNILRKSKFFVGIDSACSNLAKAVGCPAFIFYGCVNPSVMLADAEEYPIMVNPASLGCFGCRDRSSTTYIECTQNEPYCLTKLYPEDVYVKIKNYLEEKEKHEG
jgi:GT2 family glycosyltransferase